MDAVEFLKKQDRMCKQFNLCVDCPVYEGNNGHNMPCGDFMNKYPEEFVPIVEKWSKEHPVKTRQSEFLKMFPRADITVSGVIKICPNAVEMGYVDMKDCNFSNCLECQKAYWLAEVEKPNTNLINREDVIRVVDKHTNEDGMLDEDISVILEEIS